MLSTARPTYILRYRRAGWPVTEVNAAKGLPQTRDEALAVAWTLCEQNSTDVAVVESGALICIVHPDAPGIPETTAAPSVV